MRAVMAARPDDGAAGTRQPGGSSKAPESLLQAAANDELDGSLQRAGWRAKLSREHALICDGQEVRSVDGYGEVGKQNIMHEVDGFKNHFTGGVLDEHERVRL